MNRDVQPDPYRAAFNEASSELNKIQNEAERLRARRHRVAKLVEALNQRFGFDARLISDRFLRTSQLPGLSVTTRFAVVKVTRKAK